MGARGAFLKLDLQQYDRLTKAESHDDFRDRFEEIENSTTPDRIALMDKAWWGMFCILPPGLLSSDPVASLGKPRELGSQSLYIHAINDRYLSLFSPTRVGEIASTWKSINVADLKAAYFSLADPLPRPKGILGLFYRPRHWYAEFVSGDDWEYVFDYCVGAQAFFERASDDSMAALFEGSE